MLDINNRTVFFDTWEVIDLGGHYISSLLFDYEDYVTFYNNPMLVCEFLDVWSIIHPINFADIEPGDYFYDSNGVLWVATGYPENGVLWAATGYPEKSIENINIIQGKQAGGVKNVRMFTEGCIYYTNKPYIKEFINCVKKSSVSKKHKSVVIRKGQ